MYLATFDEFFPKTNKQLDQALSYSRIPSAISKHGVNATSIPLPAGSRLSGMEDSRQSSIPSGSMHQQPQGTVNWKCCKGTCDMVFTPKSNQYPPLYEYYCLLTV
jgi:hypothetical protein